MSARALPARRPWLMAHPGLAKYVAMIEGSDQCCSGKPLLSDAQYSRAVQIIEARFPGLKITALAWWSQPKANTLLAYAWEEPAILAHALVRPDHIPVRPKRVKYNDGGETVFRIKGGHLQTRVEIPEDIDAAHPFAFLRPSAIREYDDTTAEEFIARAQVTYDRMLAFAEAALEHAFEQAGERMPWQIAAADLERIKAARRKACADLAAVLRTVSPRDLRKKPSLRLVIDNTGGPPP